MKGNERRSTTDGGSKGIVAWFQEVVKQVVAGLLAVALIAGAGFLFSVSNVPLWVLAVALPVVFLFGAYANSRRLRRQRRIPDYLLPEIAKGERLRAYFEQLRHLLEKGLGEGLVDLEQELLVKPARMIEEMTGKRVQLAVFEPIESENGPVWRIRFKAGISESECREFEVPLHDSHIALKLRRGGTDMVFRLNDMHEPASTLAPGADVEAFQRAGFRIMKFVRSEVPSLPNEVTSCLVLLSREEELPNGTEDSYLMLLSRFINIHFELTGMGKQVKAVERKLSEQEP